MAVDTRADLVLAHIADASCRHVAIGLDAAVVLLVVETVLVLSTAQEGETTHPLILLVGEHIGEELVSAVLAGFLARSGLVGCVQDGFAVLQQFLPPLGRGHRVVEYRQAVAQRADILHQRIGLDAFGKPVDAHHIVLQVGSEHRAVIGKQLAAFGLDGHYLGQHLVGLLVPLGGLDGCSLEQIPDNRGREQQHDAHDDAIAHEDMSFVVLLHCLAQVAVG